jgi:hypothetical protein
MTPRPDVEFSTLAHAARNQRAGTAKSTTCRFSNRVVLIRRVFFWPADYLIYELRIQTIKSRVNRYGLGVKR